LAEATSVSGSAALNKLEIKRTRTKPEPLAELARTERRGP